MREEGITQQDNASFIRDEMTHAKQVAKDLEGRVVELKDEKQHVDEELRKFKEEHDVAMEKHEKEMAEMRRRETLAKTSAIDEFKASEEYKEALEWAASSYFDEGFDLCKKQINILYPNLDIHDHYIDPNLVDEDEEEEKDVPDANLPK